ncbi:MAG: GDP-mannose 4,6-dehydratase [Candidatus Omnitrophica bacterium]|nr:GDP-mannose 4,6-dehydratase [Candidatus Omnitrophota bacterium]
MNKIVVTGCCGFIGSHVVDALLKKGYEVTGIDDLSMGNMDNMRDALSQGHFTFERCDVCDAQKTKELCRSADGIIHLAAYKIPRYSSALRTLTVNSFGTYNILEAAREGKAKVVFASTSDVYGKGAQIPFAEDGDSVLGASDINRWAYATSKRFDEHLGFAYIQEFGLPVVILRFFGSYGPRHHLSWWGGPQSVFISAFLKDEPVTIHGDGLQTRTFMYIADTVRGVLAALENEEADGEIINIGSETEVTILNLAKTIYRLMGKSGELPLEFVPYAAFKNRYEDVRRRVPDVSKAERLLGFKARVGLEEGLTRTIKWQRAAITSMDNLQTT